MKNFYCHLAILLINLFFDNPEPWSNQGKLLETGRELFCFCCRLSEILESINFRIFRNRFCRSICRQNASLSTSAMAVRLRLGSGGTNRSHQCLRVLLQSDVRGHASPGRHATVSTSTTGAPTVPAVTKELNNSGVLQRLLERGLRLLDAAAVSVSASIPAKEEQVSVLSGSGQPKSARSPTYQATATSTGSIEATCRYLTVTFKCWLN